MTLRIFSPEFTPNYGACCTFNAGLYSSGHKVALKESLRAGASYGLQFTMCINVYEKLKTNELFSTTMDGIVFIGETKKRPQYESDSTRRVIDQCNCSNSDAFHFFPNTRPCSPNNKCLNSLKTKFISNDFIMANCKCPLQCNRTIYRTSTSVSSLLGHNSMLKK